MLLYVLWGIWGEDFIAEGVNAACIDLSGDPTGLWNCGMPMGSSCLLKRNFPLLFRNPSSFPLSPSFPSSTGSVCSAALGLHCCVRAFSSCCERGLLFVVVHGLLIAVPSLVVEHRALGARASVVVAHGLSSCGARALERRLSSCGALRHVGSSWTRDWTGGSAGGFLTTAPPVKSHLLCFKFTNKERT